VEVRNARSNAAVTPGTVRVLLRGPKRLLAEPGLEDRLAYVDAGGKQPGRYRLAVKFDVPDGIEVLSIEPSQVVVSMSGPSERLRRR